LSTVPCIWKFNHVLRFQGRGELIPQDSSYLNGPGALHIIALLIAALLIISLPHGYELYLQVVSDLDEIGPFLSSIDGVVLEGFDLLFDARLHGIEGALVELKLHGLAGDFIFVYFVECLGIVLLLLDLIDDLIRLLADEGHQIVK